MKLLLVPLDDRPITYTYPQMVAAVAGQEVIMPPRAMMGSLQKAANSQDLINFCQNAIKQGEVDAALICLDSLLYGGLITSRRTDATVKDISARLDQIKKFKSLSREPLPIYVQSAIMRISDNYDNTEEKDYWARYGRELFEWSTCLHRLAKRESIAPGLLESLERRIPQDIRQDYLDTRFRNFTINQAVLKSVEDGSFDYAVFSQDDSGAFGLNVSEKERLESMTRNASLEKRINIYAGADEVLLSMISRFLSDRAARANGKRFVIDTRYAVPEVEQVASRYEGQSIGTTIEAQIKAAGMIRRDATPDAAQADLLLIVHGGLEKQGDHITLPGLPDLSQLDTQKSVKATMAEIEAATLPVVLVDLAYANGADPLLMQALIADKPASNKIIGFAGWNTSGNTVGSALALAAAYLFGQKAGVPRQKEALNRCLFTRLVDDYAYQSLARKALNGDPSTQKLAEAIAPTIKQVARFLDMEPPVRLSFPWKRTFEIEIGFEGG